MEFAKDLRKHRAGLIEIGCWASLYGGSVAIAASGETNGLSYFQQSKDISLWGPLVLGGAVNFSIMFSHAFGAMPLLLKRPRRFAYARRLLLLLTIYLTAHLIYQIAIAQTLEPALRSVSALEWTIDNLFMAPIIFLASAVYKFGRDWIVHADEREALAASAKQFETELRIVQGQMRDLQTNFNSEPILRFESNREKAQIQTGSVFYLKSAGNYVEIVTHERTFTIYSSMKEILKQLPPSHFVQIHRSYIVNLERVSTIRGRSLRVNAIELPIGASYKSDLTRRWRRNEGAEVK